MKLLVNAAQMKAADQYTIQELGIASLATVELLMNLEDKLDMEIELDQKVETVGDLVAFIESKRA